MIALLVAAMAAAGVSAAALLVNGGRRGGRRYAGEPDAERVRERVRGAVPQRLGQFPRIGDR
ncbi:hypothetical protein GCM10020295_31730 [Streptomyces cinereospinus]